MLVTEPSAPQQLLLSNNLRFVRDGEGAWRALPVAMDAEIVAVARIGSRWFFASKSGAIAASEGVDGRLMHVADAPVQLRRDRWGLARSTPPNALLPSEQVRVLGPGSNLSNGRLTLLADPPSRSLYIVDGTGRLHEQRFGRVVRSAAFTSAEVGAVVLEDGSVHITRDGGTQWTIHDLHSDRGERVLAGPPLSVRGVRRAHVLHGRGGFYGGTRSFPLLRRELVHAITARWPHRAQGNEYAWRAQGLNLVVHDGALYRAGLSGEGVLLAQEFAFVSRRCLPQPFGASALLACESRGRLSFELIERGDSVARTLASELRSTGTSPLWFADSSTRTVWAQARCPSDEGTNTWCRIGEGGRHSFAPEVSFARAIGTSDGLLVGWVGRQKSIRAVHGETGAHVFISPLAAATRDSRMGIAADGSAWLLHPEGRELWVGSGVRSLERRTLPEGAQRAQFIDAQRGVAYGESAAELWSTADGARSWSPLALRFDGDAASVPLSGGRAFCDPSACSLGSRVEVHWQASREAPAAVGRRSPLVNPAEPAPYPSLPHARLRECSPPGGSREEHTRSTDEANFDLLPGLRMRCRLQPARWRCRFEGEARGAFGLGAAWVAIPVPEPSGVSPGQEGFIFAGGGAGGIVLQRNSTSEDTFLLVRGRRARPLVMTSPLLEDANARGRTRYPGAWLVRDEGAYTFFDLHDGANALVHFGADGHVRRLAPIPSQRGPLLAVHEDQPGAMTRAPSGAWYFWSAAGEAPEEVAFPPGEVRWCRGEERHSFLWIWEQDWVGATSTGQAARVRWNAEGSCVDEVRLPRWHTVEGPNAPARRWTSDGTHVHAARSGDPNQTHRCPHAA